MKSEVTCQRKGLVHYLYEDTVYVFYLQDGKEQKKVGPISAKDLVSAIEVYQSWFEVADDDKSKPAPKGTDEAPQRASQREE